MDIINKKKYEPRAHDIYDIYFYTIKNSLNTNTKNVENSFWVNEWMNDVGLGDDDHSEYKRLRWQQQFYYILILYDKWIMWLIQ